MKLRTVIRRATLYITTLLLAVGYPLTAMADTPEAAAADSSTQTTDQQAPPPKTYTYNPATGHWDTNEWVYNPATGKYEAVPPAPAPAPTIIDPTTPADPSADTSTTTNTGPDSTNTTSGTDTTHQSTDAATNVDVNNQITGDSTSGAASVLKNLTGGNASTGDATTTANIINNVNSTLTSGDNSKAATFTYDVMGDVNGDIMLYPSLLKAMIEAKADPNASQSISSKQNNTLTNDVSLTSTSGDATVSKNTTAGNATTGNANTVANIMNILNSMISANQSFMGTVNIYGNLNGDILIAPDFIPQMIANNKDLQAGTVSQSAIQSQNKDQIVNNISLAADSGAAAVTGNTSAGNATTGSANTNVVIFNLTGHDIIASNSLLVFVNVLGKWVGAIVDAPAGATSAMIGSNVTKNDVVPDMTVAAQTNNAITNNVTLVARTGDAVVSDNTQGGNATSGNATASANVANISNSQIGISNWFGILFINVFGTWDGYFGVNTAAGDPVQNSVDTPASSAGAGNNSGVFVFVPRSTKASAAAAPHVTLVDTRHLNDENNDNQAVLAAATNPSQTPSTSSSPTKANSDNIFDYGLLIAAGSLILVGVSVIGLRRLLKG